MVRIGQGREGGWWVYPGLVGSAFVGTLLGVMGSCGGESEQSGAPAGGEVPIVHINETQSVLGDTALRHITIDPSQFEVQ